MTIDLLIPSDEFVTIPVLTGGPNPQTSPPTSFTIPAFHLQGTFSSSTSDLSVVAGFTGTSPPNPFSAYSAATHALDSNFSATTGVYDVYQTTLSGLFTTGSTAGQTTQLNNLFSLDQAPAGTIITGFLDETVTGGCCKDSVFSTAQSSSLAVGGTGATPLPPSIVFMFTGLLGLIGFGRKWAIRAA